MASNDRYVLCFCIIFRGFDYYNLLYYCIYFNYSNTKSQFNRPLFCL